MEFTAKTGRDSTRYVNVAAAAAAAAGKMLALLLLLLLLLPARRIHNSTARTE
jgi:hypothetical protein